MESMQRKSLAILVAGAFATLAATSAFAVPIDPTNVRPVPVTIPSADGPGTDVQSILDSVYGCSGCVNAFTDQQTGGMWASSSAVFPTVTPILSFEYAGNKDLNSLGFWSGTDTGGPLNERLIFTGQANVGVRATIAWTGADSGTIGQTGGVLGDVVTGAFSNIPFTSFGFFLNGPGTGSGNFYTVDQLNSGNALALAYHGTGTNGTNWVIGFEDTAAGDRDFNDLVIRVESINAVPEPEIYAMIGIGLALMGFVARRRQGLAAAA